MLQHFSLNFFKKGKGLTYFSSKNESQLKIKNKKKEKLKNAKQKNPPFFYCLEEVHLMDAYVDFICNCK